MIPRLVSLVAALALLIGVATACTPEPTPTPSPTGFASEEEAFAAAEETYRAYMAAVNERRDDPQSQPDPQTFLVGEALQLDISTQQRFREMAISLVGPTRLVSVTPRSATSSRVLIEVCIDSSAARVVNAEGVDVTPADRADLVALSVQLVAVGDEVAIESSMPDRELEC